MATIPSVRVTGTVASCPPGFDDELVVTIPATAEVGDRLLLFVADAGGVLTQTAPTGWTDRATASGAAGSGGIFTAARVFDKVCASGEPGTTVTVAWTAPTSAHGVVVAVSPTRGTNPIVETGTVTSGGANTASQAAPTLAYAGGNSRTFVLYAVSGQEAPDSGTTVTPTAGTTLASKTTDADGTNQPSGFAVQTDTSAPATSRAATIGVGTVPAVAVAVVLPGIGGQQQVI